MTYHLNIKILSNDPMVVDYYMNYQLNSDSGVDLIIPEDMMVTPFNTHTIDHMVQCTLEKVFEDTLVEKQTVPYLLFPRSSISKTRLRMANSIGLIDRDYRGNIMAKVDMKPVITPDNYGRLTIADIKEPISKYSRLFQIVAPNLEPISKINIVDSLDCTERGEGGFGSTGV